MARWYEFWRGWWEGDSSLASSDVGDLGFCLGLNLINHALDLSVAQRSTLRPPTFAPASSKPTAPSSTTLPVDTAHNQRATFRTILTDHPPSTTSSSSRRRRCIPPRRPPRRRSGVSPPLPPARHARRSSISTTTWSSSDSMTTCGHPSRSTRWCRRSHADARWVDEEDGGREATTHIGSAIKIPEQSVSQSFVSVSRVTDSSHKSTFP